MKVIQCLPKLELGGVERGTLEIDSAICDAGHESLVVSGGGRMVQDLVGRHIQLDVGAKSFKWLSNVYEMQNIIRKEQPDIIHVRSRVPAWVVWCALKWFDYPKQPHLVSTLHGLHSVNWYSRIMGCGERVIAVSNAARDYLIKHQFTTQDKIQVIHRGVDEKIFYPEFLPAESWFHQWHQHFPHVENSTIITLVGRPSAIKGHARLIECLVDMPEYYGLFVGVDHHDAYTQQMQQYANHLGVPHRTIFLEPTSQIRELYKISSVVLSLSTKPESFGRTILEALSLGVKAIGRDIGGVGEILHSLYPEGIWQQDEDLKQVISRVIENNKTPKRNDKFLLSQMRNQTLTVYQLLQGEMR